MIELLANNPLLLLFAVMAIGYPLGHVKIGSFSLGISAVLFVGLAAGALDPRLQLPDLVYLFGLVLFVYTIGLSSAPGFVAAFKRRGVRDNLLVVAVLVGVGGLAALLKYAFGLKASIVAGLYAGALTNTPALAGVLEALKARVGEDAPASLLAEPTVAYSVAYPMGVIGMLLAVHLLSRLWKVDFAAEAKQLGYGEQITHRSITITRDDPDLRVGDLAIAHNRRVVFGRLKHQGTLRVPDAGTHLAPGDVVSVIGTAEDVQAVAAELGVPADEPLELDRTDLDFRRMFVSDRHVAGKRIGDLHLPQRYGAIITRVRRGDVDIIPNGQTVLELGDRVRVLAPRENLQTISSFFGDSYRALSEIDIMTLGVGIALGLLVGTIGVPLPGGTTFKLGSAGGPLIVSLVLGALGRTGNVLWQIPYSANLTLRQFGLTLFLAGIGIKAGSSFASTFASGGGLTLLLAGTLVTAGAAIATLVIAHKILKIPFSLAMGMLGGLQTQPAVLAFANEKAGNDLPNVGYATVYPVAFITKIIVAQLLLVLLS